MEFYAEGTFRDPDPSYKVEGFHRAGLDTERLLVESRTDRHGLFQLPRPPKYLFKKATDLGHETSSAFGR